MAFPNRHKPPPIRGSLSESGNDTSRGASGGSLKKRDDSSRLSSSSFSDQQMFPDGMSNISRHPSLVSMQDAQIMNAYMSPMTVNDLGTIGQPQLSSQFAFPAQTGNIFGSTTSFQSGHPQLGFPMQQQSMRSLYPAPSVTGVASTMPGFLATTPTAQQSFAHQQTSTFMPSIQHISPNVSPHGIFAPVLPVLSRASFIPQHATQQQQQQQQLDLAMLQQQQQQALESSIRQFPTSTSNASMATQAQQPYLMYHPPPISQPVYPVASPHRHQQQQFHLGEHVTPTLFHPVAPMPRPTPSPSSSSTSSATAAMPPTRKRSRANLRAPSSDDEGTEFNGESRLQVSFESVGEITELPPPRISNKGVVPNGISGSFTSYGETWQFLVRYREVKQTRGGRKIVCIDWQIKNRVWDSYTSLAESMHDALRREDKGVTLCNKVFIEALDRQVKIYEREVEEERQRLAPNELKIANLTSRIKVLRPKRIAEGPLLFGLRHRCVQEKFMDILNVTAPAASAATSKTRDSTPTTLAKPETLNEDNADVDVGDDASSKVEEKEDA